MIVTSVQIKTVKTQKHLYCPVFTKKSRTIVRLFCFIGNYLKTVGHKSVDTIKLSARIVGGIMPLFCFL